MNQSLMPFEAEIVAAEALARAARTEAKLAAAAAKLQAKLAEQAQRTIRKRQEEMDKNTRRWKREEATRKRNDLLVAQCGINWTTMRAAHVLT